MRKIVVGVTGASGSIYAEQLLSKLNALKNVEFALVMSKNAKDVWKHELDNVSYENYKANEYDMNDYMAPFASGSSRFDTMILVPCSMGTLGRIAHGISDSLISRAADVMLKERRKLILVARETPYNLVHINNMKLITEAGGIICPATPSFYSKPQTFADLAATVVDRALSLAGLDVSMYRWNED